MSDDNFHRRPAGRAFAFCLSEYYKELERSFDGGFDVGLSRDPKPEQLVPPLGAFLIATRDGAPVGCVALKGDGSPVAEIKRLWVSPDARGLGLAKRLMEEVERVAAELGIRTLRLDTNRALTGALAMYRNLGWDEVERFNDDPYAHYFFQKHLT